MLPEGRFCIGPGHSPKPQRRFHTLRIIQLEIEQNCISHTFHIFANAKKKMANLRAYFANAKKKMANFRAHFDVALALTPVTLALSQVYE
jgi:hypothetical protein